MTALERPEPVDAAAKTPEEVALIEKARKALYPVWARHGSGVGHGACAWCGGFLVSQGGVAFLNPHREGCGYVALCALLGLAP